MTTQVNPPYFLRGIVPRNELSKAQLNLIDNMLRVIEQLYVRTGGDSDNVEDTDIGFSGVFSSEESGITQAPQEIINNEYYYSISSSSHTTAGDQFIQTSGECTITLSPSASGDTVLVQPTDYSTVTISGQINGGSEIVMRGAYDLAVIKHKPDLGEWVIS